jgi:hypothetical protein
MSNEEIYEIVKKEISTPIINSCLDISTCFDVNPDYKILVGGFLQSLDLISEEIKKNINDEHFEKDLLILKSIIKDSNSFIDFLHEIIIKNAKICLSLEQVFFYVQACCLGMWKEAFYLNNNTGILYAFGNIPILQVNGMLQYKYTIGKEVVPLKIEASFRCIKIWRLRKTLVSYFEKQKWEDLLIGKMLCRINKLFFNNVLANTVKYAYFEQSNFAFSYFGYVGELDGKAKEDCNKYFFTFTEHKKATESKLSKLFI